eukprot:m.258713 g.258713  ORF g.258713 m.258713 type:complete len:511 (-) comp36943_c0_seq1:277-1809(-)
MAAIMKSFALFLCVSLANAAIDADLVTSLPGLAPGAFTSRIWSGYIEVPTVNGSAHVHYVLVENSKNDSNAPIVVWQQGGPGGSSLIGMFTEVGPLTLNDQSFATKDYADSGVPTVFPNPNSWHTAPANYLFVEHPAPTGFSYCDGDCYWNDTSQAEVNYEFYVKFFESYPEYADKEFYFTGESYAGVLVPSVALQILKHRTPENRKKNPWNLQGFALGNDCPGNRVFTCTPYSGWLGTKVALDFRFGHGMISESLYAEITEACKSWWKGGKPYPDPDGPSMEGPPEGSECRKLLEDPVRPCMSKAGDTYDMGGGYFLYDTCTADLLALDNTTNLPKHHEDLQFGASAESVPTYPNDSGEYACGQEKATMIWLNLPEVQKALHVKLVNKTQFSFSTGLHYEFTTYSLLDEYKNDLIPNFRIMQYSGDADPCVPYVGTQRWIESLDLKVESPWQPWTAPGPHDNNMVAGYNTVFENNFTFVTIRDAGHMAPRYKPTQALYMFKKFLKNERL